MRGWWRRCWQWRCRAVQEWRRRTCRLLCVHADRAGRKLSTVLTVVSPPLAMLSGDGSGGGMTCRRGHRKPADKINFLVFVVTLSRKTSVKTYGCTPLVEGDGVGRCCWLGGGGLFQDMITPSSDTSPGGSSMRWGVRGGELDSVTACRLDQPTTLWGRREGSAGGVSPGPNWRALTPRPLGGGRGGVGQGGPCSPCYPGPQEGGEV